MSRTGAPYEFVNDAPYEELWELTYRICGEEATLDDYLSEQERFVASYVRIPETAIKLFYWGDVTESDDEPAVKAAKMTDALLSSGQEFLVP